jgi:hypothetical protein
VRFGVHESVTLLRRAIRMGIVEPSPRTQIDIPGNFFPGKRHSLTEVMSPVYGEYFDLFEAEEHYDGTETPDQPV